MPLQLDPDQAAAVAQRHGPCLVLAGPGSGKTRVVTERVAVLARNFAESSLVLTYTVDAAQELQRRLEGRVDASMYLAGNFHQFAHRLLETYGEAVGYPFHPRVPSDAERLLRLEYLLEQRGPCPIWHPADGMAARQIIALIDTARQHLVGPRELIDFMQCHATEIQPRDEILYDHPADCAEIYEALMDQYRAEGIMDHDGVIFAMNALLMNDEIRTQVHSTYVHLIVDEYQDTNIAQGNIVGLLAGEQKNIMVVADDDQTIYGFRGAFQRQIEDFREAFPGHQLIRLYTNYRSAGSIVTAARTLITRGQTGPPAGADENHDGHTEEGPLPQAIDRPVEVLEAVNEQDELDAIVNACRAEIEGGRAPSSIACLARRNAQADRIAAALRSCGIPVVRSTLPTLSSDATFKDVLALVRAVCDPRDVQAQLRCLRLPRWATSARERTQFVASTDDLPPHHPGLLLHQDLVAFDARIDEDDCQEVVHALINLSGLPQATSTRGSSVLSEIAELMESFLEWNDDHRTVNFLRFLEHVAATGSTRRAESSSGEGVAVGTVHSAKGLEWDAVFIAGVTAAVWRARNTATNASDDKVDEERRLLYVAMTRARSRLTLTFSKQSQDGRTQQPSPFLTDLRAAGVVAWSKLRHRNHLRRGEDPGNTLPPPTRNSFPISALEAFSRCPRQAAFSQIWKLPLRPSPANTYLKMYSALLRSPDPLVQASQQFRALPAVYRESGLASITHQVSASDGNPAREGTQKQWWPHKLFPFPLVIATNACDITIDAVIHHESTMHHDIQVTAFTPYLTPYTFLPLPLSGAAVAISRHFTSDSIPVSVLSTTSGRRTDWLLNSSDLDTAFRRITYWGQQLADAAKVNQFPPHPRASTCNSCPYRIVCDEGRTFTEDSGQALNQAQNVELASHA